MKWRHLITTKGFKQACAENKLHFIPTLDWVVGRDCWPHTIYYLSYVILTDFNTMYALNRAMYAYKRRYIETREKYVRALFPPCKLFKFCEGVMPENCPCEKS